MAKIKDLDGHTARVLHMATSPDGCSVVSAATAETLRFWDIFAPPAGKSSLNVALVICWVVKRARNPVRQGTSVNNVPKV